MEDGAPIAWLSCATAPAWLLRHKDADRTRPLRIPRAPPLAWSRQNDYMLWPILGCAPGEL